MKTTSVLVTLLAVAATTALAISDQQRKAIRTSPV